MFENNKIVFNFLNLKLAFLRYQIFDKKLFKNLLTLNSML